MAFIETGFFCTDDEYRQGLPRRINESELRPDDLYTFAMRLRSKEKEAAKLAVRALDVVNKVGFTIVNFAFVDANLEPLNDAEATVRDGLANNIKNAVVKGTVTGKIFDICEAYFKDYFEEQFGGILAESNELILTS